MNKEQLGRFIGDERKALGLTQRELAERLHVTDKAVSKWERALSYPDVTLLEPLAAALDLGVEELMACRRDPAEREEEPVKNLLTISNESLQAERRRGWSRLAAVLLLLLAAGLTILYAATFQTVTDTTAFQLKETEAGKTYLYLEERGNKDRLLKLRCGDGVEPEAIPLTDEGGDQYVYRLTYRWNRWTREGMVTSCEPFGISLGSMMNATYEAECAPLFGHPQVFYAQENFYPDPYAEERGRVFLCDARFWIVRDGNGPDTSAPNEVADGGTPAEAVMETILLVKDCLSAAVADVDGDGENEAVIRTRWTEKPYTIYDLVDGEITESWPDTVPEEVRQLLRCEWE